MLFRKMNLILEMNYKEITSTITLPGMLMNELVQYAKKKKVSENEVIEIAVKSFLEKEIRNQLIKSFKKFANDPDAIEMAEWDWKIMLNN